MEAANVPLMELMDRYRPLYQGNKNSSVTKQLAAMQTEQRSCSDAANRTSRTAGTSIECDHAEIDTVAASTSAWAQQASQQYARCIEQRDCAPLGTSRQQLAAYNVTRATSS